MKFEIDKETILYYRIWEPETLPIAKAVVVHGYAEHSGRYDYVGKYLAGNSIKVYAFDNYGHGQSSGKRALVTSIENFVSNLDSFVKFVKKDGEDLKLFIIGHSMGGAIAAIYAAEHGSVIDGIITSSAAIMPVPNLYPPFDIIAEFFSKFIPEAKTVNLPAQKLSKDQKVVENYKSDSLTYTGKVKLRTAAEFSRIQKIVKKKCSNILNPILIMHGSKDRLAKPEGSRLLYNIVSSKDKEIKIFEGLKHELFNEPEKDKVLNVVKEWLYMRL